MASLAESFLDLIYPQSCFNCGDVLRGHGHFYICAGCEEAVRTLEKPFCPVCGMPGENILCPPCLRDARAFSAARAYAAYEGPISEGIKKFKFKGKPSLARTFAKMLFRCAAGHPEIGGEHITVPVPLCKKRERERGYNQSCLLARELCRLTGSKLISNSLIRVKNAPPQTGLSGAERRENVKDIFSVKRRSAVAGKAVLLIDDVFTTGATADECSRALLEAGAARVNILTVARTP